MAKDKTKPCVKCEAVDRNTRGDCRPCARAGMKAWQKAHPKKFRAGVAAWKKAHPKRVSAHGAVWRKANPEKKRFNQANHMLKRNYNLTLGQYNAMLEAQGGVCAICGQPETALDRTGERVMALAVDHDHGKFQVRMLLCRNHNTGLGLFGHNSRLLRAAADYLDRWANTS
jgi:Recombination endonuclease VII